MEVLIGFVVIIAGLAGTRIGGCIFGFLTFLLALAAAYFILYPLLQ
jgi:hypothetical protein